MARLQTGDKIADFTLDGIPNGPYRLHELAEQTERGLIIYMYPRANTPGCTTEACDFRDSLASLQAAGYGVIGISPDRVEALQKFAHGHALPFTLVSDPDHECLISLGGWGEKKNYGRIVTGVIRSTIVVNTDATVALALYNVRAKGHVARLRRELGIDD